MTFCAAAPVVLLVAGAVVEALLLGSRLPESQPMAAVIAIVRAKMPM